MKKVENVLDREKQNVNFKIAYIISNTNLFLLVQNRYDVNFNKSNIVATVKLNQSIKLTKKEGINELNHILINLLYDSASDFDEFKDTFSKLRKYGWEYPKSAEIDYRRKITIALLLDTTKGIKSNNLEKIINPNNNVYVRLKGIYNEESYAVFNADWIIDNTTYQLNNFIYYIQSLEKVEKEIPEKIEESLKVEKLEEKLLNLVSFGQDGSSLASYFLKGFYTKTVTPLGYIYIYKELLDRNNIKNKFNLNTEDFRKSTITIFLNCKKQNYVAIKNSTDKEDNVEIPEIIQYYVQVKNEC